MVIDIDAYGLPTCEQCYRIDGKDYERICEQHQDAYRVIHLDARTGEQTITDHPERGCAHECHNEWVDPKEIAYA